MYQRIIGITLTALLLSGCYHLYRSTPRETSIVTGSFVVEPRNYTPFKVVVGNAKAHHRVEGTFSARGANNDIEVLLLEETQFLNWQNHHAFRATYDSGRVTSDKIRIDLPKEAATYFMIFDNRFSFMSNKAVTANLKLCYD